MTIKHMQTTLSIRSDERHNKKKISKNYQKALAKLKTI